MNFRMKLAIFWRSFFLQTGWNYRNYQNMGLCFTLLPFLNHLYRKDPEMLPSVLTRYLQNFNTHPVMASFCFGALARQERSISLTKNPTQFTDRISAWNDIKRSLSITAASIGDRLFWGTLKPLTLLLALFIWLVLGINFFEIQLPENPALRYVFCAMIAAFLAFNSIALFIKWKGISLGYNNLDKNCFGLTKFDWNTTIYQAKHMGLFLTIGMILLSVFYFMQSARTLDVNFFTRAILVLFFICISFITRRLRIPNLYLYLVAVAIFNLACYL